MRSQVRSFFLTAVILSLVSAPWSLGQTVQPAAGANGNPTRHISPQVVAGDDFATEIVIMNLTGESCGVQVSVAPMAQMPPNPVTINGTPFSSVSTIPGFGSRTFQVDYDSQGGPPVQGGIIVDTLDHRCFGQLFSSTRYLFTQNDQLDEIFSYGQPSLLPPGACAVTPIVAGQGSDGMTQRSAGVALQAAEPIMNGEVCLQLFAPDGSPLGDPVCLPFDGNHRVGLVENFFTPDLLQGPGTWRVCNETPSTPEQPAPPISSIFIDVTTLGNRFQLGAQDTRVTGGECVPDASTLCLNGGRFEVKVDWANFSNPTLRPAGATGVLQDSSGLFYFLNPDNWEMLVKVLNGCGGNEHYWVFAAATTDVEFKITVVDTNTQITKTYFNPLGTSAAAITDTSAFATCP